MRSSTWASRQVSLDSSASRLAASGARRTSLWRLVQHALDQAHQLVFLEGLLDEIHAPFFMVSTAMGTSPWPVMKTMGSGERAFDQAVLQLQPGHAAHADVHNQAGHFAGVVAAQEGLGGVKAANAVVLAFQQPLQRIAHGLVVIHNVNSAFFRNQAHAVSLQRLPTGASLSNGL
jgi:hypothetical protein